MLDIPRIVAEELGLRPAQVTQALALFAEGATVPFIARYRKEMTGEMNEIQLRAVQDRYGYLTELEERKQVILASIEQQGKLTEELKARIDACMQKTELEDLYLPYKPKKRTRATIAREKGLEPLARAIAEANVPASPVVDIEALATPFLNEELGVTTIAEALRGASDILAEEVAETASFRAHIRGMMMDSGVFVSKIRAEYPEGTTKFEMYRQYRVPVRDIAPHNMLALRRGEAEGVILFDVEFDDASAVQYLDTQVLVSRDSALGRFYRTMLADAWERLMKTSLVGDVRYDKKVSADEESVRTFEANLRNLLLASPAGMKPTLGVDPGFRTGCKVAALDATGKFLEYEAIFPHGSVYQRGQAAATLTRMIATHGIELIAIGNGTASRETDAFIAEVLAPLERPPLRVMVNESGASIYSASDTAIEEFPDLDITVRGAISIARRLQDPLAELVKIDPKSIGVGQYQHDVDQRLLKRKLDDTVESCVNHVGVDVNLASKELLGYVAGLSTTTARNIIAYRNEHGPFRNRRTLLKVPRLGDKAFEQAAGFLRIREGENPLDNTAVHPERYALVERIARDLDLPLDEMTRHPDRVRTIDVRPYLTEDVGEPTLRDILQELEKPGRDPREQFRTATFKDGVREMSDLAPGMVLEGVVTNVANFGAFVDIGVHQDGLVHISQLADTFVRDPKSVVKVGQIVSVTVLEVNLALKRISLSMKKNSGAASPKPKTGAAGPKSVPEPRHSLEDLKRKFGH